MDLLIGGIGISENSGHYVSKPSKRGAGIFINPNCNIMITCTIELVPIYW